MNLLIVQARMGSSRLPGKVLMRIRERPLLELQYLRVKPARLIDKMIIATTTNPEDDAIELFCKEKGIHCHRGSDWDVLSRYYNAAREFSPDAVIRITSDCPLHHYTVIDHVVERYMQSGADYLSNSNREPDFLEDGFDVEVFSFRALEIAFNEAKLLSEREHVTPFIKHSGRFNCQWERYNAGYNSKLSVDTINDFKAVKAIFNSFETVTDFTMEDVIGLLQKRPDILHLNQDSEINSGYKKSIANDRNIKDDQ